jgi:biopolymer transport protein ExbD
MSGGDVGGEEKKHGKQKKGRKPKRRMGVRIDMTPMVDVAFLLLTFFMLTTVFRKPQTLEITLPPSSSKAEIQESSLLNIKVDENADMYWSVGLAQPKKIDWTIFKKLIKQQSLENDKVVILVKLDRKTKYHFMVDIIDELNLVRLTRYSIATMTDLEKEELKKAVLF